MRRLIILPALVVLLSLVSLSVLTRAQISTSRVVHVGTAAADVIVVVVETDPGVAAPTQNPAAWMVNGVAPTAVGRWSYGWDEAAGTGNWIWPNYPVTMRHHLYIQLGSALINDRIYSISTPYGTQSLLFNDRATRCESIKVNQVGYYAGSTVRYANLGIYLGDLGARQLAVAPSYEVIAEASGAVVLSGQAAYVGDDTRIDKASGEHVYRLDLAAVPVGGPYYVSVRGYGRSYAFGVGPNYSRQLAYVHTRGLYHQRCGIALERPFTQYTRGLCHSTVQVADGEPPTQIPLSITGPSREIRGGYHDAGDYDRRLNHTLIPAWMLNLYEAFPDRFYDAQFNIPESGNGIPDWLDEALWGVLLWENLQESDGGVRAGTEADRHPNYGDGNAETDRLVYRTFRRDSAVTAIASGLFAHASRMVRPFDASRAARLLTRAINAWDYVQRNPANTRAAQKMYGALQLYMATSDQVYHDAFKASATYLMNSGWPEQYFPSVVSLDFTWRGMIHSPYFFAYTITDLPVDATIRSWFITQLTNRANGVLNYLRTNPYPMGPVEAVAWGAATSQGRSADPVILTYRLTRDQRYRDAASELADYSMGLNPLGKSYTTGLGANPPNNPLQGDSYYTIKAGLGNVPGIVIFGPMADPSNDGWQTNVWRKVYPAWGSLPMQRRFSEGWSLIPVNEFTPQETMVQNACLYAFLNDEDRSTTIPVPAGTTSYSIADRGGLFVSTPSGSGTAMTGYARVRPGDGMMTPSGLAIFTSRQNGVVVSEAGVPAAPPIRTGRIYAEVDGPVNTGLAIANPNDQSATLSFYFTNAEGIDFGAGSTVVAPHEQIAVFLGEAPFRGGSNLRGTLTFSSNAPVSVIALRGLANQRSEFLMTTLPVTDPSSPGTSGTVIFPHFADGGGWTTQVILVNPTDQAVSGQVEFFGRGSATSAAQPVTLTVDGQTNRTFVYSIPGRSSRRLRTSGIAASPTVGSVRITPSANSTAPSGLGIFSFNNAGVTVTEAGVPALGAARALRMYAQSEEGTIQTGVAIANPSPNAIQVNLDLTTLVGAPTGGTRTITIPANGQVALLLNEMGFQSLPRSFRGILRISTDSAAGVSVVGLRSRTNERRDFLITTTPPVDENTLPSIAELIFPHLADGGGYTTQFILFTRSAGPFSAGALEVFGQSGRPLNISLN